MKSFFLFFSCLFFSYFCQAWMVTSMMGSELHASYLDKPIKLNVGVTLQEGTKIQVGLQSKLKLVEGSSVIIIAENSEVILKKEERTISLQKGDMRVNVHKEQANRYKFSIPSIVAGVRGTEFFMSASNEKEVLCVLEGEVEALETKTNAKAIVKKDIGWIRVGQQPGKLVPVTSEQKQKWLSKTSF